MRQINRISTIRKQRGLTQLELAQRIGVTQSTVSEWESGAKFPRVTNLQAMAQALDCTADDLLRADDAGKQACT